MSELVSFDKNCPAVKPASVKTQPNFLHNNCENKAAFKYYVSMLERVEGVGAKKADIEDGGKGELDPRA